MVSVENRPSAKSISNIEVKCVKDDKLHKVFMIEKNMTCSLNKSFSISKMDLVQRVFQVYRSVLNMRNSKAYELVIYISCCVKNGPISECFEYRWEICQRWIIA